MEKTKRIITLFLAIVCALALCVTAGAADTSVITDMKTDCVVDAAGSCQITQTVTIDIAGTEDTIELPLASRAKRISVAGYKYKKTTQDGYTVLVLSSNGGFAGSRTFTISYTVSGLVSEQDNVQTLTLPLLAPTIFLVCIVNTISCFKVFSELYPLFNGKPGPFNNLYTVVYYIRYAMMDNRKYGIAAAAALVLFLFIFVFTMVQLLLQKKTKRR